MPSADKLPLTDGIIPLYLAKTNDNGCLFFLFIPAQRYATIFSFVYSIPLSNQVFGNRQEGYYLLHFIFFLFLHQTTSVLLEGLCLHNNTHLSCLHYRHASNLLYGFSADHPINRVNWNQDIFLPTSLFVVWSFCLQLKCHAEGRVSLSFPHGEDFWTRVAGKNSGKGESIVTCGWIYGSIMEINYRMHPVPDAF